MIHAPKYEWDTFEKISVSLHILLCLAEFTILFRTLYLIHKQNGYSIFEVRMILYILWSDLAWSIF
jgi:hypothetical protein